MCVERQNLEMRESTFENPPKFIGLNIRQLRIQQDDSLLGSMRALMLQRLRTAMSGDYIPVWLRQPSPEFLLNS